MMRRIALVAAMSFSLLQAKEPLQAVEVKTVQTADHTRGAAVRIEGTAGELNVETWDQPRVQATLSSVEYAEAHDQAAEKKKLERIRLVVEKESGDVVVEMKAPKRHFWGRLLGGKTDASITCTVMVPLNAKLVVRHGNGTVVVYGSDADIDATAGFGDIVLQLASTGKYSVDARVRVGTVYTDYQGKYRQPILVGQKFVTEAGPGARKVTARVGVGGISIVSTAPPLSSSGPAPLH
jgi:hypothetical protein